MMLHSGSKVTQKVCREVWDQHVHQAHPLCFDRRVFWAWHDWRHRWSVLRPHGLRWGVVPFQIGARRRDTLHEWRPGECHCRVRNLSSGCCDETDGIKTVFTTCGLLPGHRCITLWLNKNILRCNGRYKACETCLSAVWRISGVTMVFACRLSFKCSWLPFTS